MSTREVRLRSTVAGFTAEGRLHSLSLWFILVLRLMMGLAFLQSGADKVLSWSDFAYMLTFLAVAAFGAGRVLGLDSYIEQYEVNGRPLIERYPWAANLLG